MVDRHFPPNPSGGRFSVPFKKCRSAIRPARPKTCCSARPSTQEMGVHHVGTFRTPFGSTMHVVPEPLKVTGVRVEERFEPGDFRPFS